MVNVQLNDEIFHPLYNKYGWRNRFETGATAETSYMWNEGTVLDSTKKCFDGTLIYTGVNPVNAILSGRPDGMYLANANGTNTINEW